MTSLAVAELNDTERAVCTAILALVDEKPIGVVAQTRALVRALNRQGYVVARASGGSAPYGWRLEHGQFVEVPEEQRVICEILRLGQGGMPLRDIAAFLNERGMLRSGRVQWHSESVRRVLRREARANPQKRA